MYLSILFFVFLQKGYSQKNDPLKEIDIPEVLMHLDWPNMAYFDAQNKEVSLEKKEGRVVFMGNSITQGCRNICLRCLTTKTISTGE